MAIDDTRRGWIEALAIDLGAPAAARLMVWRGGGRITPPRPENAERSLIARHCGNEVAKWLAERYAGECINVPNGGGSYRRAIAERRRHVAEHPDRSAQALALELGITARNVEKIRQRLREGDDERQGVLPL